MRARQPDDHGTVVREGVAIAYEVFGDAPRTILLMPTWSIIPSLTWKALVPSLARHFRVVTFDGRGSGASDRPVGSAAYDDEEFVADARAVLARVRRDTDPEPAPVLVVGLSCGVAWSLALALEAPEEVAGVVAISPALGLVPGIAARERHAFLDEPPDPAEEPTGWRTFNRHTWLHGDYDAFLRFFFGQMISEPHSTKHIEDCVAWGHEIGPERLVDTELARTVCRSPGFARRVVQADVPVLVIHGDDDRVRPYAEGVALADATGGSLLTIAGGGHAPHAREPVVVGRAIREFAGRLWPETAERRTWTRGRRRPRRALYLTSPIGLGHVRRDLAIADALRKHHPDLQIDWLTQEPATTVLARAGEHVHPASTFLASECAHVEDEAAEHDLHAFQAIRRMDEILVANFGVFDDLVSEEPYDLVIGDEAWDVDHHLHENPELKRFSFAWLTDFVGWIPMADGGPEEAALTADYNAEMLEQRARFGRVRDRSVFVGNPADVVDEPFGPGLPRIREWTKENFAFSGYVTGFDPVGEAERVAVRRSLGLGADDLLCVVTVGGSGVGEALLRRLLDAVPVIRRTEPRMTFLVVTGPRIDPHTLPRRRGVRLRGFVPDLHRTLGAADVALVQGGLTTCMELTAQRVPFVYVPLRHHFEQNIHVPHRLAQYGAGHRLSYEEASDPYALASALLAETGRTPATRPVETDGADRAAALLADLL